MRVRRHWAALLKVLLQTVEIMLGAFFLSRLINGMDHLLWYVAVAASLHFACKVLEWWRQKIVMTDERLMIDNGVIRTKYSMVLVTKVTDVAFRRSVAGQLLGYGSLRIESAEQNLRVIDYVPWPEEVFLVIVELIFGQKNRSRSHMLPPPLPHRRPPAAI